MKKTLKLVLCNFIQNTKWYIESLKVSGESTALLPDLDGNLLFVIPHADDELLPSWKTLTKYKNQSYIYYCGMTGSNSSADNKRTRETEIRSFANDKGLNIIVPENWEESLIDAINNNQIECIFLPSFFDWHPEHRLIDKVFISRCSEISRNISLYWYSVTVPIQSIKSLLMPIAKREQKEKYNDFRYYYISQRNMPIRRFMRQEILNAKKMKYYAGECYLKVTVEDIRKAIAITDESRLSELKSKINCISYIRKSAELLYKNLYVKSGINNEENRNSNFS